MLDIIVADDERAIRNGIVEFINENIEGARVVAFFADGSEVIEYLKKQKADIIIADVRMYEVSGLDVAKYVYEQRIKTAVIIISGYSEFSYAHQAIDYNVCSYLLKPVTPLELRKAIKKASRLLNDDSAPEKSSLEKKSVTHKDDLLEVVSNENEQREKLLMEKALDFIDKNYCKDISLSDVAGSVYLSTRYFGSIFKRYKEEGFVQYLNDLRINEAIRLLKTGKYTIKEVSTKVGYNNCTYFIKLFKKYTNVTPKQYCILLDSEKEQSVKSNKININ